MVHALIAEYVDRNKELMVIGDTEGVCVMFEA